MAKKRHNLPEPTCFCGSSATYAACCGVFISGQEQPCSAEKLMRSRYSAYVLKNSTYLLNTWHPSTRPQQLDFSEDKTQWQSLSIIQSEAGQIQDTQGKVAFIAYYKINGRAFKLCENSLFSQEAGQWFYLSGECSNA